MSAPKLPSAKSIMKKLAAEIHACERVVLKCAVECVETSATTTVELHDAVADYLAACRRMVSVTTLD